MRRLYAGKPNLLLAYSEFYMFYSPSFGSADQITPKRQAQSLRVNLMHPLAWIPPNAASLLDIGCNVGALIHDVTHCFPRVKCIGVDVNATTLEKAHKAYPEICFLKASGDKLPFSDHTFDCVTCIEVLEHIPVSRQSAALSEIHRVLCPGGRLVLRVPHAGWFAWLDSNNLRFRLPWLYRSLIGGGLRDHGYREGASDVVWHYHYSQADLLRLAGPGWTLQATRYGGLVLFPICDIMSWPFYRLGELNHPLLRLIQRFAHVDYSVSFGSASYGILVSLRKA